MTTIDDKLNYIIENGTGGGGGTIPIGQYYVSRSAGSSATVTIPPGYEYCYIVGSKGYFADQNYQEVYYNISISVTGNYVTINDIPRQVDRYAQGCVATTGKIVKKSNKDESLTIKAQASTNLVHLIVFAF